MTLTVSAYEPDPVNPYEPTGPGGSDVPKFIAKGSTRAKVQVGSTQDDDTGTRYETVGGVSRPVLTGGLHIPLSAPRPTAGAPGLGWEYVVTAVSDLADTNLLGRRYRVVNAPAKSFATARRLDVVEVEVP